MTTEIAAQWHEMTGAVLKSGKRPPDYVPIEFDRHEPSILICCETTPAWVDSVGDHVD